MLHRLNNFLGYLKPKYDDDSIDRLNYIYTSTILVGFALTMAAKQYVGKPLQCWVPAQFKGGWEQYVENYCFVENTYWVAMSEHIPDDTDERIDRELQYYQWVPFVLAIQAVMFYIPRLIWGMYSGHSGLSITGLVSSVMQTRKEGDRRVINDPKKIDDNVRNAADFVTQINEFNQMKKRRTTRDTDDFVDGDPTVGHKRAQLSAGLTGAGMWITVMYLFCKLLYIINVVGQLFLLNAFLGPEYTFWGFGVLADLARGREWETSGQFPRVTLCDFEVRRLGNLQRWTVQCVLMINMFNEKIYLFLWWWFMIVAVVTILSLLYWLFITFNPNGGVRFVLRFLRFRNTMADPDKVHEFVHDCLHYDGITILRLLSDNAGDVIASAVVNELYKIYTDNHPLPPKIRNTKSQSSSSLQSNPILDRNRGYLESLQRDTQPFIDKQ